MKKIIKHFAWMLFLCFCVSTAIAGKTSQELTISNWQNQLSNQIERQAQAQTGRPWQLAIISVAHSTQGELEKAVLEAMKRNRLLAQVVLVRVSPSPKVTQFKNNFQTKQINRTDLSNKFRSFSLASMQQILRYLDHSNSTFYTGLVIDAHGTGKEMHTMFEGRDTLSAKDFFEKIEKEGIKIDVLELNSCSMGSLDTLYYATKSGMVDYLLASPPPLIHSPAVVGLLYAASNVPGSLATPPQAAKTAIIAGKKASIQRVESELGENIPPFTTSMLAYYLPELRIHLENWRQSIIGLFKASVESHSKGLPFIFREELWLSDIAQPPQKKSSGGIIQVSFFNYFERKISLDNFIANLLKYGEKHSNEGSSSEESDEQAFSLFQEESLSLQHNLKVAIKQGLCYHNQEIYSAADIDTWPKECLGSVSLDLSQVRDIVLEGRENFPSGN